MVRTYHLISCKRGKGLLRAMKTKQQRRLQRPKSISFPSLTQKFFYQSSSVTKLCRNRTKLQLASHKDGMNFRNMKFVRSVLRTVCIQSTGTHLTKSMAAVLACLTKENDQVLLLRNTNRDIKIYEVKFNDDLFKQKNSSRKTKRMVHFYSPEQIKSTLFNECNTKQLFN